MKINFKLTGALLFAVFIVPGITFAQTQSVADMQTELQQLLAEVASLEAQITAQGGSASSWCYDFASNLSIGMSGSAVTALQTALNKDGESVTANGTFDDQTAAAVTAFQEKYGSDILAPYGLSNGTGYAGKSTRAKLNVLFGCAVSAIATANTGESGNAVSEPQPVGPEPVPAPISVITNSSAAATVTITSPTPNHVFANGDTMNIQWTPASTGVAMIVLQPTSGGPWYQIYGAKVDGDPVDYSGSYVYHVLGMPAGSYYLRLYQDNQGSVLLGQVSETISSPAPVITNVTAAGATPTPGSNEDLIGTNLPTSDATIIIDPGSANSQTITPNVYNLGGGGNMNFYLPSSVSVGSHTIEVREASGITSNVYTFTVVSAQSLLGPTITSLNPTSAAAGQTVTVTGFNFDSNSYISFGNVPTGPENLPIAPLSYTPTTLTFAAPSTVVGTFPVYVAEHNSSLVSNQESLTISSVPVISAITPNQAGIGQSITISGTNLDSGGGPTVTFYSSSGSLAGEEAFVGMTSITSQSLTFTLGQSVFSSFTPGTYQVYVQTPDGTSNAVSFTFTASGA